MVNIGINISFASILLAAANKSIYTLIAILGSYSTPLVVGSYYETIGTLEFIGAGDIELNCIVGGSNNLGDTIYYGGSVEIYSSIRGAISNGQKWLEGKLYGNVNFYTSEGDSNAITILPNL